MALHSDQCAVAADGSLLDASKIIFYDDPDDDVPLDISVNLNSSTSAHVHPIFQGGHAPGKIAGSRRSGRVSRPSARITDPNNLVSSLSRKRSATVTISTEGSMRAASRAKVTVSDDELESGQLDLDATDDGDVDTGDDNTGMGDDTTEGENVEDGDDADAEKSYRVTKGMGDDDRRVCPLLKNVAKY